MKKTLMINLGGLVFHIDEDAYILLNQYLESLKRHFSKAEGAVEILADIESRMAEILGEKLSETRQVITADDAEEVISIMGRPVEIDGEETKDESPESERGGRRFFRNPDEKVIAGVCSGIAAYFNMDPVWVRLFFIIFLAAGGSGILLYLILWIVMPEAQSTSDRLAMRGKKINISNIEKSVRREARDVGSRLGTLAGESAATVRRAGAGAAPFFEAVGKGIAEVLRFTGRVLVILAGLILIVLGIGLLIAFLAYLFGWTGLSSDGDVSFLSFPDLAGLVAGCRMPLVYLQAILMIVIGIPLFMIFYNGLRMVFRFSRVRHLGLTMFNVWLVGLFFLVWAGFRIVSQYKHEERKKMEIGLQNPSCDTLFVMPFDDDPGMDHFRDELTRMPGDLNAVISEDDGLLVAPKLVADESVDSCFSISQTTLARGKTRNEAYRYLTALRFRSASSGDTLRLSPFLLLPGEKCWRGQMIDLVIRVPRGKYLKVDHRLLDLGPFGIFRMNSTDDATYRMTEFGLDVAP